MRTTSVSRPTIPHTDTTWPNSKEYIEKMLADFDDDVAYKVLRGNAIRMLELDRV